MSGLGRKSASKTQKNNITLEDLVLVTGVSDEVSFQGRRLPSSETRLHDEIYKEFPGVGVVVHPHDPVMTNHKALAAIRTKEFLPYGTVELARAACQVLKNSSVVVLRNHGQVVVGKDFVGAFRELERVRSLVK